MNNGQEKRKVSIIKHRSSCLLQITSVSVQTRKLSLTWNQYFLASASPHLQMGIVTRTGGPSVTSSSSVELQQPSEVEMSGLLANRQSAMCCSSNPESFNLLAVLMQHRAPRCRGHWGGWRMTGERWLSHTQVCVPSARGHTLHSGTESLASVQNHLSRPIRKLGVVLTLVTSALLDG